MTTKELIKQLKEKDPDGNLTIALVHKDEYLETSLYWVEKLDKQEFTEQYKDVFDLKEFKNKKKILVICPFND